MLIDASDIVAINDRTVRSSKYVLENIALGHACNDLLQAAAYLNLTAPDDVTVLRLAIRLINSGGAAGSSILSGYYQQAAADIRDLIEIGFLLDFFARDFKQVNRWRVCGNEARRRNFSPHALRQALAKLDGGAASWDRDKAYALYSQHGTHIDPDAVILMSPNMQTAIGPFPDRDRVVGLSLDLARYLAAATRFVANIMSMRPLPDDAQARPFRTALSSYEAAMLEFTTRTTKPTD